MDQCGLQRIDFLKIDCEGGEYDIFRNIPTEQWKRIQRIAMEFHELGPGQEHQELVTCLRQQGFHVEVCKPLLEYRFMHFGQIWARRDVQRRA